MHGYPLLKQGGEAQNTASLVTCKERTYGQAIKSTSYSLFVHLYKLCFIAIPRPIQILINKYAAIPGPGNDGQYIVTTSRSTCQGKSNQDILCSWESLGSPLQKCTHCSRLGDKILYNQAEEERHYAQGCWCDKEKQIYLKDKTEVINIESYN